MVEVPPGRKRPLPEPRLGRVTPCCLRQVVNAVRAAVAVAPELDAVVVVAAVFLLDAVALEPQAETPTAAASATSVTSAALDKRFADLIFQSVLSF